MSHTRGSNLICIRSRDLLNTNDLGNNGLLVLQQPIIANENEKLYVCVLSATFPNSWYNLSLYLNNNTISFKETGDSSYKIITLAEGSYNINELMTEIKSKLETIAGCNSPKYARYGPFCDFRLIAPERPGW